MTDDRALLAALFHAAVAAADPLQALRRYLPAPPKGRTIVIGAGKAAAQMAQAFDRLWPHPLSGVVVTHHGAGQEAGRIKVMEAAHPVPDTAGLSASAALMAAVHGLTADDLVVALVSGGGSALLPAPAAGLTLDDEIALNSALLASGAPIGVMNALRKQVSTIKGGRLALMAYPARVVSLIISDVPGDDPAQVASGPTVADALTRADARALARDWQIALPPRIVDFLASDANPCPRPDDPRLAGHEVHVIASAQGSLAAAADLARAQGITAHILSDAMEGEAQSLAQALGAMAVASARHDAPFAPPALLLSGGETTVRMPATQIATARGGRNSTFALALADVIAGHPVTALAADTDGIDGTGPHAGAFVDGSTATRLRAQGMTAQGQLARHDSAGAFAALGDEFITGATGTNVNDFRAILVR